MSFPGIRLAEQIEQKFRCFRVCLNEKKRKKTSDCKKHRLKTTKHILSQAILNQEMLTCIPLYFWMGVKLDRSKHT